GGESTQAIRTALLQNASAFINAKISYKSADRSERFLEASFTRYSVLFTGETLPDGNIADAVYLLLNEPYWQVIDAAMTRPLDYNYMRSLPPAAQRFYEIVSYQIYGALFHKNERARLRYSEYCMLSTATRYATFDQVKKQMYKIHRPHLESGYLAKIAYEQTTDDQGQADWWMYYVPGPNASREYQQFTGNVRKTKGRSKAKESPNYAPGRTDTAGASLFLPFSDSDGGPEKITAGGSKKLLRPQSLPTTPQNQSEPVKSFDLVKAVELPNPLGPVQPEIAALITKLIAADLNREVAERFARERPDECRRQLLYLPYVTEFTSSRGAYLRRAIEQGFSPPRAYTQSQEEAEARQKKQAEAHSRNAAEASRKAAEAAEIAKTTNDMAQLEKEAPEAFSAFEAYLTERRQQTEKQYAGLSASIKSKALKAWDLPDKRREEFRAWQALQISQAAPSSTSTLPSPTPDENPEDASQVRSLIKQALKSSHGKSKAD
ncbi:MAG: hypothetical protein V4671_01625, partial [Armatimonadota bacterium]